MSWRVLITALLTCNVSTRNNEQRDLAIFNHFFQISTVTSVTTISCCYTPRYTYLPTYLPFNNMTPTKNLRIRNIHTRSPRPLIPCLFPGCSRWFKNPTGLSCHSRSKHKPNTDAPNPASNDMEDLVCYLWFLVLYHSNWMHIFSGEFFEQPLDYWRG